MKTVNLREVRNNFNKILEMNQEVIVESRGKPLAKIKPFTKADIVQYYLEKAQEASGELGITKEKGEKLLEQVRNELLDEGRY
jgi:antitoxin (DNA-binding transcriptional repressor) of toxin-antitoxin stability system